MQDYQEPSKYGTSSKKTSVCAQSAYRSSMNFTANKDLKFIGEASNQTIVFHYRRGITYTIVNRDIKLKNQSSTHYIRFKIQSNNPLHYKVHPTTAEIPPNKTIEIVIQINGLDEISQIGPSFFAKFVSDKFKLSWLSYREGDRVYVNSNNNKTTIKFTESSTKIFKVKINIDQEHIQLGEIKKKPVQLGQQICQSLDMRKKQLTRLENLISEKQLEKIEESFLNCNIVLVFALISFILGFVVPFQ